MDAERFIREVLSLWMEEKGQDGEIQIERKD